MSKSEKNRNGDDEMRAEYDFSKGVRGKVRQVLCGWEQRRCS